MTSFMSTLHRGTDQLVKLVRRMIIRLVLVLVTAVVAVALGSTMDMDGYGSIAAPATPSAAGAPVPVGVDTQGGLFNPGATLDTAYIDDLREDPYGKCVAEDGVLTPTGACVDAARIWEDEVSSGTWDTLTELGYTYDADDHSAMRVPAEYVILGGKDGNEVLAVDVLRPVTPRSL